MNEVIRFNGQQVNGMTSLQIAEVTGKQHAHVMRDIRNLIEKINKSTSGLVKPDNIKDEYHRGDRTQYKFLSEKTQNILLDFCFGGNTNSKYVIAEAKYTDNKGEERTCYELNKKACFLLASGYDVALRAKIIDRWEELERTTMTALPNFSNPAEAARAWAEQYEQKLLESERADAAERQVLTLTQEIEQMQPKISYYDTILASKATVTTTQIAQDYGMSAKRFNKILEQLHVQHKVNGQWILYAPYISQGYVHSKPFSFSHTDGRQDAKLNTEWTQKGRLFLYQGLKNHGILPLIEQ